jgi:soluble lytic murein transglycosylase-like protein
VLYFVRYYLLLLVVAGVPSKAIGNERQTVYVCVDEVGHTYQMSQPVAAKLASFDCSVRTEAAPVVSPRSSYGQPAPPRRYADDATLASIQTAALDVPRIVAAKPVGRSRSSQSFDALIVSSAQQFKHDPLLLKAIIHVESAFNQAAISHKGAIGLMQIMPATGKRFGVEDPQRDLLGPATNIHVGARYLRILRDMFGERLELAVAAYNAGEGAVMRYGQRIPPYPETQAYVQRVMATYRSYRQDGVE